MSRLETTALASLVSSAAAGQYSLPKDVVAAYGTYTEVKKLKLPSPATLHPDTAAAMIVDAVAAGETTVDPLAVGRELRVADETRAAYDLTQRVLQLAIEQAGDTAVAVANAHTDVIVSEHLAPAVDALHAKAREAVAALQGFAMDPASLVSAPAKARAAYASLVELVAQRKLIFTARRWCNAIGNRVAQHDVQGLFAEFAEPLALTPWWKPPAQVPRLPAPEDPIQRLAWAVGGAAAPARLWFPTVEQQDAQWMANFGEAQQVRARVRSDTRVLAGLEV